MIASTKEIDALNITLFNSCINFTPKPKFYTKTKILVFLMAGCLWVVAAYQRWSYMVVQPRRAALIL